MEVLNIPTTTTTPAQMPLVSDSYSTSCSNTSTASPSTSPVSSFLSMPLPLPSFTPKTTNNDFCQADLLKCGSCMTEFLLSDILVFIQHKTKSCKQASSTAVYPSTDFHHCCQSATCTTTNPDNLACSSCPETFKNPKSLLEHAQFTHKINIFIDNKASSSLTSSTFKKSLTSSSPSSSSSATSTYLLPKVSSSSSIYKKSPHHLVSSFDGLDFSIGSGNGSASPSNSKASGNGVNTNEIFIDVIPSSHDRRNSLYEKSQSYNITFSSSLSPSSTSSMPKSRSVNSHLNISSSSCANPEKKGDTSNGKEGASEHEHDSELVGNSAQAENAADREKLNGDSHHDMAHDHDDDENENHHGSVNDYFGESASSAKMGQHRNRISLTFQNENSSSSSSSSVSSSRSSSASSSLSAHSGSLNTSKYEDDQDQHIHSSSKSAGNTPTKMEPFENSGVGAQGGEAAKNGNVSSEAMCSSEKMMVATVGTSNENTANQNEKKKDGKKSKQTASFYCNVCSAAFNQKIHLTKHSAKHTGIKPFKCNECSYSTVERSHLKVHVRVHTGEKPFKCTFCEYATAQSSTLKIHKKRHHNNANETSADPASLGSNMVTSNTHASQANDSSKQEPTSSSSPAISEMSNEEYLTKKKIAAKRQHQSKSKDSSQKSSSSKKLCNMNMTNLKNNYLSPGAVGGTGLASAGNPSAVLNLNTNLANMVPGGGNHLYTSVYFPDMHDVAEQSLGGQNLLKFLEMWGKNANGQQSAANSAALNISNLQSGAAAMQNQSKFFESLSTMLNMANKAPSMPQPSLAASLAGIPSSAILSPYFTNNSSLLVNNSSANNCPLPPQTSQPSTSAAGSNRNSLEDPFSILKENRLNLFSPLLNANNVRFNSLLTSSVPGQETNSSSTSERKSDSCKPTSSSSTESSSSESSENKLLGLANIALEREIN